MKLRSSQLGNTLKKFLWLDLGLTGLLIINIIVIHFAGWKDSIITYDSIVSFIYGINVLTYSIIFLVWLYKVHKDLHDLCPPYPISPGGALARVLIPFYNLYGMWNVFSTMAKEFKNHLSLQETGARLAKYIPYYYLLYLVTTILNTYLSRQPVVESYSSVWFISYVLDSVLLILYILMIRAISTGLSRLSEQIDTTTPE